MSTMLKSLYKMVKMQHKTFKVFVVIFKLDMIDLSHYMKRNILFIYLAYCKGALCHKTLGMVPHSKCLKLECATVLQL